MFSESSLGVLTKQITVQEKIGFLGNIKVKCELNQGLVKINLYHVNLNVHSSNTKQAIVLKVVEVSWDGCTI